MKKDFKLHFVLVASLMLVVCLFFVSYITIPRVEADVQYTVDLPIIERCVNYNCWDDPVTKDADYFHTGYKVMFYEDAAQSRFMDEEITKYLLFPTFTPPTGAIYGGRVIITDWSDPDFDLTDPPFEDSQPRAWTVRFDYPPSGTIDLSMVEVVSVSYCFDPNFNGGSVTPNSGVDPLDVTANAYYSGDYDLKQFDYGDGTSTTTSSTHQYSSPGTYTVQTRARSECDSTWTAWEELDTVVVEPSCIPGNFGAFYADPARITSYVNEDILTTISLTDDCGTILNETVTYELIRDPEGSRDLIESNSLQTPFDITMTEDGQYAIDLTYSGNTETFQTFKIDKTPPNATLSESNPVVDIEDPADRVQSITFNAVDPLVNNARSGILRGNKIFIISDQYQISSVDPSIFDINVTGGNIIAQVPIGNWTTITCSGLISNKTYKIRYNEDVPREMTATACSVSGTSYDQQITIDFDVSETILGDANNIVSYEVINFDDAAGNITEDIIGDFEINRPTTNTPIFTLDIVSPVDGATYFDGQMFDLEAIADVQNMNGNIPTYTWTTNEITGSCPQPTDTADLLNENISVLPIHSGATCEYTISGNVNDAEGTPYTATDSVTISIGTLETHDGWVDSGWDLYLDNEPPNMNYKIIKDENTYIAEEIWLNAEDPVEYVGDIDDKIAKTCPLSCTPYYHSFDYNNDGYLNDLDAQFIMNVWAGTETCPADKNCDVNNDSTISASDGTRLLLIANGDYDNREDCGDSIDNNCDGVVNEGCGGSCSIYYNEFDYNYDGNLNSDDSTILSNIVLGFGSCPSNKDCDADESGNANPTGSDISHLNDIIAGIIDNGDTCFDSNDNNCNGNINEDNPYDSGVKSLYFDSIEDDNNALYGLYVSDLDVEDETWRYTFVEPNLLHKSTEALPEEEHPFFTMILYDNVNNEAEVTFTMNYDTVSPKVAYTTPEDQSLLMDLNSPITLRLQDWINTENPTATLLDHGLQNIDANSIENINVFIYDITSGTVTDKIEFDLQSVTDISIEGGEYIEYELVLQPEGLEKLRTYQLRINEKWDGTYFAAINEDDMIMDAAGNPLEPFDLTFSTLNKPDILRIEKKAYEVTTTIEDDTIAKSTSLDPQTTTENTEIVDFYLTLLPDISESIQTSINPTESPYFITDLLPPHYDILGDAEYRIIYKDGTDSGWQTISLSPESKTNVERAKRGFMLVWEFTEASQEIPWGGRLELRYQTIVHY